LAVWLIPEGLERFSRALVARHADGKLIFVRLEFPLGPEMEVLAAWQDGRESLDDIEGVTPALEVAFLWLTWRRLLLEERRKEVEDRRLALEAQRWVEERRSRYQAALAEQAARRRAARRDFATAARGALAISGAELLDYRSSARGDEMVVQFRLRRQRFECVVEKHTLRVVDAGICLTDHHSGERGDDRFTLESLPPVIIEAIETGQLHIYRYVED
ncbi:MAG: hypothetical protein HN348_11785, partial [Proteobacteria bacterium]|nr:hypothetical protein [Pseudomonadota bacterium]